ncbi:MAG: response regulator [Spirochaetia bacterium]|nr:response regulator [Spirochaetia bacterium]
MIKANILIAEDDPVAGELLKSILTSGEFETTLVDNGKKALDHYMHNKVDVIIIDMHMPVMDGRQLISELRKIDAPVTIIVETEDQSPATIIDIMKMGVSDYIIKPVGAEKLIFKVHNAIDLAHLKQNKMALEKERQMRMEKQLDWNVMKERITARSYDRFDKTLFGSLKASFTQGAGMGSLISLLSLIKKQIKQADGNYLVKKDLMDLVFNNALSAQKALNAITEISNMLDAEIELEKEPVQKVYELALALPDKLAKQLSIKSQNVKFNEANYDNIAKQLLVNLEFIQKAFEELTLNAMKFSLPKSTIYIFSSCTSDRFYISFMSEPDTSLTGDEGIPREYEKLIFEPFFRLVKFVFEEYNTLDFGLGLTMVEKIIRKNHGKITLSSVTDNSNMDNIQNKRKINFEIALPLVEASVET